MLKDIKLMVPPREGETVKEYIGRLECLRDDIDKLARELRKHNGVNRTGTSGAKHPLTALNEATVREIRGKWARRSATQIELAEEYGVSNATISLMVNRKTWKHVD